MIRPLYRILLGLGVLAGGLASRDAASGEAMSPWLGAPGDTSYALGSGALSRVRRARSWADLRTSWPTRELVPDSSGSLPAASLGWDWARATPRQGPLALDAGFGSGAPGPVVDPKLWGANGNVLDIARSGNTLYIAGAFRSVGVSMLT
jgi:hypothetical protein